MKISAAVAGGAILTACGVPDKPPGIPQAPTTATPEKVSDGKNLILVGEPGKDIWQTEVAAGQGMVQALEPISKRIEWVGGLNWISADRSKAVFLGEKGKGGFALMVLSGLFETGQLPGPELAKFNPNLVTPGDSLIVGEPRVVGENFFRLLKDPVLEPLKEYLTAEYLMNEKTLEENFNVSRVKRLGPGDPDYSPLKTWQYYPVTDFVRQGKIGPWSPAGVSK